MGDPYSHIFVYYAKVLKIDWPHVILSFDSGEEATANLFSKIQEGIEGLENQPNTTEKYSEFDQASPSQFGVVKMQRDNDMELHTNQQVIHFKKKYFISVKTGA